MEIALIYYGYVSTRLSPRMTPRFALQTFIRHPYHQTCIRYIAMSTPGESYVFDALPRPTLSVQTPAGQDSSSSKASSPSLLQSKQTLSSSRFPIHRIYCVGRNYADHAIEMGGDPNREEPFFFSKPPDAAIDCAETPTLRNIHYPLATKELHHEYVPDDRCQCVFVCLFVCNVSLVCTYVTFPHTLSSPNLLTNKTIFI